jgi:hypothetical protein
LAQAAPVQPCSVLAGVIQAVVALSSRPSAGYGRLGLVLARFGCLVLVRRGLGRLVGLASSAFLLCPLWGRGALVCEHRDSHEWGVVEREAAEAVGGEEVRQVVGAYGEVEVRFWLYHLYRFGVACQLEAGA